MERIFEMIIAVMIACGIIAGMVSLTGCTITGSVLYHGPTGLDRQDSSAIKHNNWKGK